MRESDCRKWWRRSKGGSRRLPSMGPGNPAGVGPHDAVHSQGRGGVQAAIPTAIMARAMTVSRLAITAQARLSRSRCWSCPSDDFKDGMGWCRRFTDRRCSRVVDVAGVRRRGRVREEVVAVGGSTSRSRGAGSVMALSGDGVGAGMVAVGRVLRRRRCQRGGCTASAWLAWACLGMRVNAAGLQGVPCRLAPSSGERWGSGCAMRD